MNVTKLFISSLLIVFLFNLRNTQILADPTEAPISSVTPTTTITGTISLTPSPSISSTPTSTGTPTLTPTKTATPTKMATKTPTPVITVEEVQRGTSENTEISSTATITPTSQPEQSDTKGKIPSLAYVFIGGGIIILGTIFFLFLKNKRKYNGS